MTEMTKAEPTGKGQLLSRMANRFGVDQAKLLTTLKSTAFRQKDGEVSNEQMMALLVVADQHGLNPFTREIYAFPDKGGIVPVVGVDGWSRIINEHPEFDGLDFEYSTEMAQPGDERFPGLKSPAHEWIEIKIHRKDRSHPIIVREYLDEVYRPPFTGSGKNGPYTVDGPWQTHPKRFHRHKTLIQGARIGFGFTGIYDQDEAERITEAQYVEVLDITPKQEPQPKAPEPDEADQLVSEGQLRVIRKKTEARKLDESVVCEEFQVDDLAELPAASVNDVLSWLDTVSN